MKDDDLPELDPNQLVRQSEGKKYFGFGPTRLKELEEQGVIPPTFPFSPGARARGWTGLQINTYRRKLMALNAEQAREQEQAAKATKAIKKK